MDRTRSLIHTAPDAAKALSPTMRQVLLLLDPEQPTRPSGIPGGTFKALRDRLLARSDAGEKAWYCTALGVAVQEVLRGESACGS